MKQFFASLNVLVRTVFCAGIVGGTSTLALGQDIQLSKPTVQTASLQSLDKVAQAVIPALDLVQVQIEDEQRFQAGMAPRFAVPHEVALTPSNAGTWEQIDARTSVWRLVVQSPGSLHINLGFTQYHMTPHGRLSMYNPDFSDVVRPFTASDNQSHGQLWTPPVNGPRLVVEVTIPTAEIADLQLTLGSINVGYRKFGPYGDTGGGVDSQQCNIDVLCPEGAPWANQIQAVAMISIGGSAFCTGFMVNNTAQDRKPYFMTADHCGLTSGNAGTLVVFWNYQNSFCRTPGSAQSGQPGNGSLSQFSNGSIFRASWSASDMALVELSTPPNPAWNVTFAGWNRNLANSANGAGIHHPNTEEKRISFYSSFTNISNWPFCSNTGSDHVRVFWSSGITEGGSSGSPLFDSNKRVIGQLHGGGSSCASPNSPDCYGRFATSWFGGGSNATRLSNWLDPTNSGATVLDTISAVGLANDTCINATNKPMGTHAFSNLNGTTEGIDEPASCATGGYTQYGADVWFKFVANCTGTATVSVCGATFNTKIAAYGACPASSGQALTCNDDFCGQASQVSFPVNSGTVYRFRIGGHFGATGTGNVTISCTPSAPTCPSDLTNDNQVNVNDLLAVINAWGPCVGCPADVNDDNQVNVNDLLAVINAWGACP